VLYRASDTWRYLIKDALHELCPPVWGEGTSIKSHKYLANRPKNFNPTSANHSAQTNPATGRLMTKKLGSTVAVKGRMTMTAGPKRRPPNDDNRSDHSFQLTAKYRLVAAAYSLLAAAGGGGSRSLGVNNTPSRVRLPLATFIAGHMVWGGRAAGKPRPASNGCQPMSAVGYQRVTKTGSHTARHHGRAGSCPTLRWTPHD